jgi:hypothetical protein
VGRVWEFSKKWESCGNDFLLEILLEYNGKVVGNIVYYNIIIHIGGDLVFYKK